MSQDHSTADPTRRRLNEQVRELESKAVKARTVEVRVAYLEMAQRLRRVADRSDHRPDDEDADRGGDFGETQDPLPA